MNDDSQGYKKQKHIKIILKETRFFFLDNLC